MSRIVIAAAASFALTLGIAPTLAEAQPLDAVAFGTRMRIATCTGATVVGAFGGVSGDGIALAMDTVVTRPVTLSQERQRIARVVPSECVRTFSVFHGHDTRTGRGALIGAGFGVALVGWALAGDGVFGGPSRAATTPASAFAVVGAVVLTGLGALIGSVSGPERWSAPQRVAAAFRTMPPAIGADIPIDEHGLKLWATTSP